MQSSSICDFLLIGRIPWRAYRITPREKFLKGEIKYLVDVVYPEAEKIFLIMDNLNTHKEVRLLLQFVIKYDIIKRTEENFVKAVDILLKTDHQASRIFVCDGLNIHKSESPVRFVAEKCGLQGDPGSKGKSGILKILNFRFFGAGRKSY